MSTGQPPATWPRFFSPLPQSLPAVSIAPATQDPTIAEEVEAIVQALYEQPNHNKLYPEQIVILTGGDLKGGGFSGWHGLGTLQAAGPPVTSTYLPTAYLPLEIVHYISQTLCSPGIVCHGTDPGVVSLNLFEPCQSVGVPLVRHQHGGTGGLIRRPARPREGEGRGRCVLLPPGPPGCTQQQGHHEVAT